MSKFICLGIVQLSKKVKILNRPMSIMGVKKGGDSAPGVIRIGGNDGHYYDLQLTRV